MSPSLLPVQTSILSSGPVDSVQPFYYCQRPSLEWIRRSLRSGLVRLCGIALLCSQYCSAQAPVSIVALYMSRRPSANSGFHLKATLPIWTPQRQAKAPFRRSAAWGIGRRCGLDTKAHEEYYRSTHRCVSEILRGRPGPIYLHLARARPTTFPDLQNYD